MTTEAQARASKKYDEHQAQIKIKFDLRDPEQKKVYMKLREKKDSGHGLMKPYIMNLIQKDMEKKGGLK